MIPLCDLTAQYGTLRHEIDSAMREVAESGCYILGPNVKAFEREMAAYCGSRSAVGVGSGTDALYLALRALGVGPGDEVITTPFSFVATSEAICQVGATPVFVDIHPSTNNLDPALIEPAITSRTRAVLPVHLFGHPCDMDRIMDIARKHGLFVVEDCAQALGATFGGRQVGTFGDAGCLSFFPSKNLGCFGDGGMVITNREDVAEQVDILRRHGGRVKYHHEQLGLNSRLDELQAAILRVKLRQLDRWNRQRRAAAYRYHEMLCAHTAVELPVEPDEVLPAAATAGRDGAQSCGVYHQYTIQLDDRDTVLASLQANGIGCAVYYPVPLHKQPVHYSLRIGQHVLAHAERAADRCLSLPMFPELTYSQQVEVVRQLRLAISRPRVGRTRRLAA